MSVAPLLRAELEFELLFLLVLLFQMGNHRRVRKRRGVTQGAPVGNVTKQPAHDFSAARFRQFGGEKYLVRPPAHPSRAKNFIHGCWGV